MKWGLLKFVLIFQHIFHALPYTRTSLLCRLFHWNFPLRYGMMFLEGSGSKDVTTIIQREGQASYPLKIGTRSVSVRICLFFSLSLFLFGCCTRTNESVTERKNTIKQHNQRYFQSRNKTLVAHGSDYRSKTKTRNALNRSLL